MTISRTQSTDNKYVDKEAIIESIKPLLTSRVRTESFVGTLHYNGNIFWTFWKNRLWDPLRFITVQKDTAATNLEQWHSDTQLWGVKNSLAFFFVYPKGAPFD